MSINSPSSFKKSVSGTGSCEKEVSSRLGFAGITSSVGIKFVYFLSIHWYHHTANTQGDMLITYLYLVYDQLLQLNTNCAWPFKQGKEFFLVDLGDETNKYFFVQCDQINLMNKHFMIWVPLFLYLLFFLYLFRPLAWLFFWPCWCHRARGIFFF